MDYTLQLHSSQRKYPVPRGLHDLMADIAREVLRRQPRDLEHFVVDYLQAVYNTREAARGLTREVDDLLAHGARTKELYAQYGLTLDEAEHFATKIQATFRGWKTRVEIRQHKKQLDEMFVRRSKFLTPITGRLSEAKAEQAATSIQASFRGYLSRKNKMCSITGDDWSQEWLMKEFKMTTEDVVELQKIEEQKRLIREDLKLVRIEKRDVEDIKANVAQMLRGRFGNIDETTEEFVHEVIKHPEEEIDMEEVAEQELDRIRKLHQIAEERLLKTKKLQEEAEKKLAHVSFPKRNWLHDMMGKDIKDAQDLKESLKDDLAATKAFFIQKLGGSGSEELKTTPSKVHKYKKQQPEDSDEEQRRTDLSEFNEKREVSDFDVDLIETGKEFKGLPFEVDQEEIDDLLAMCESHEGIYKCEKVVSKRKEDGTEEFLRIIVMKGPRDMEPRYGYAFLTQEQFVDIDFDEEAPVIEPSNSGSSDRADSDRGDSDRETRDEVPSDYEGEREVSDFDVDLIETGKEFKGLPFEVDQEEIDDLLAMCESHEGIYKCEKVVSKRKEDGTEEFLRIIVMKGPRDMEPRYGYAFLTQEQFVDIDFDEEAPVIEPSNSGASDRADSDRGDSDRETRDEVPSDYEGEREVSDFDVDLIETGKEFKGLPFEVDQEEIDDLLAMCESHEGIYKCEKVVSKRKEDGTEEFLRIIVMKGPRDKEPRYGYAFLTQEQFVDIDFDEKVAEEEGHEAEFVDKE